MPTWEARCILIMSSTQEAVTKAYGGKLELPVLQVIASRFLITKSLVREPLWEARTTYGAVQIAFIEDFYLPRERHLAEKQRSENTWGHITLSFMPLWTSWLECSLPMINRKDHRGASDMGQSRLTIHGLYSSKTVHLFHFRMAVTIVMFQFVKRSNIWSTENGLLTTCRL